MDFKIQQKRLNQQYGIVTSIELEGGLVQMCNLSELIEEKGIEKGELQLLISLAKEGHLSVELAAQKAKKSVEEFEKLMNDSKCLI